MRREVSVPVVVGIIALVVIVVGVIIWRGANREQPTAQFKSGPMPIAPSQQGTKLGGKVIGDPALHRPAPGFDK